MKKIARIASATGMMLSAAAPAFAQNISIPQPESVKVTNVGTLISGAVGVALLIAGILVFAMLLWGGIQWIMSGGDKAKTEEARNRITAALVGLAVVAAAWAVMKLIEYFFGISVLSEDVPIPKGY
ncbi:hypothetical protein ACFL1M_02560 [Patescibacteria group bacterium]